MDKSLVSVKFDNHKGLSEQAQTTLRKTHERSARKATPSGPKPGEVGADAATERPHHRQEPAEEDSRREEVCLPAWWLTHKSHYQDAGDNPVQNPLAELDARVDLAHPLVRIEPPEEPGKEHGLRPGQGCKDKGNRLGPQRWVSQQQADRDVDQRKESEDSERNPLFERDRGFETLVKWRVFDVLVHLANRDDTDEDDEQPPRLEANLAIIDDAEKHRRGGADGHELGVHDIPMRDVRVKQPDDPDRSAEHRHLCVDHPEGDDAGENQSCHDQIVEAQFFFVKSCEPLALQTVTEAIDVVVVGHDVPGDQGIDHGTGQCDTPWDGLPETEANKGQYEREDRGKRAARGEEHRQDLHDLPPVKNNPLRIAKEKSVFKILKYTFLLPRLVYARGNSVKERWVVAWTVRQRRERAYSPTSLSQCPLVQR